MPRYLGTYSSNFVYPGTGTSIVLGTPGTILNTDAYQHNCMNTVFHMHRCLDNGTFCTEVSYTGVPVHCSNLPVPIRYLVYHCTNNNVCIRTFLLRSKNPILLGS